MNWTDLRNRMPVTRSWAYFDHAAVAPMTQPAVDILAAWARDVADNGVINEGRWLERVEEVRRRFAVLLAADPAEIAFVKNTTEGIAFVAEGLPWQSGDNVVTAAEEYPSNVYPWMNLAARGVEVRLVPSRSGRIELDELVARLDGRTRIVSLSAVEFASGFRNDLDTVGELCRRRNILFFVDAIQALGVVPIDVARTPIDFLAADGHKWLLGPEGAGIFWIRRDLIDRLHPIEVGWHSVVDALNFSSLNFHLRPDAVRWECGTLNLGGILALGASLDLLLEVGIPALEQRIISLTDRLCAQSPSAGWTVFSSRVNGDRSGIVSLIPPEGRSPREAVKHLRQQGVVVTQRAERLRVSPHAYNTEDEIDHLVRLLGEMR